MDFNVIRLHEQVVEHFEDLWHNHCREIVLEVVEAQAKVVEAQAH